MLVLFLFLIQLILMLRMVEAFVSPELLSSQWDSLFEHVNTIEIEGEQQVVLLKKKRNSSAIDIQTVQEIAKIAKLDDIRSICMTNHIRNRKEARIEMNHI